MLWLTVAGSRRPRTRSGPRRAACRAPIARRRPRGGAGGRRGRSGPSRPGVDRDLRASLLAAQRAGEEVDGGRAASTVLREVEAGGGARGRSPGRHVTGRLRRRRGRCAHERASELWAFVEEHRTPVGGPAANTPDSSTVRACSQGSHLRRTRSPRRPGSAARRQPSSTPAASRARPSRHEQDREGRGRVLGRDRVRRPTRRPASPALGWALSTRTRLCARHRRRAPIFQRRHPQLPAINVPHQRRPCAYFTFSFLSTGSPARDCRHSRNGRSARGARTRDRRRRGGRPGAGHADASRVLAAGVRP